MGCLRGLSYLCAVINLIFSFIMAIGSISICSRYDNPEKQETRHFQETPYWLWIETAILNVLGFLSTILLIIGIRKERANFFKPYFVITIFFMISLTFRAFEVMITQVIEQVGAGTVAKEFFSEMGIVVFLGVIMIPILRTFNKMTSGSYFRCVDCGCCRSEPKPSPLPNY